MSRFQINKTYVNRAAPWSAQGICRVFGIGRLSVNELTMRFGEPMTCEDFGFDTQKETDGKVTHWWILDDSVLRVRYVIRNYKTDVEKTQYWSVAPLTRHDDAESIRQSLAYLFGKESLTS